MSSELLLDVVIPGAPVPKQRARLAAGKDGSVAVYTPSQTTDWEDKATAFFLRAGAPKVAAKVPLHIELEMAGCQLLTRVV